MSCCLAFLLILLLLLQVNSKAAAETDDGMCGTVGTTLCVQRTLGHVARAARQIHHLAVQIEQNIHQQDPNGITLQNHIHYTATDIEATLPSSKTHGQFGEMNNIDKSDLVHLIKEEDHAANFLYKSVLILRNASSLSKHDWDDLFDTIQTTLQEEIICNYRSILHVYAETWSTIDDVHGLVVSRTRKRQITSLAYHTHVIIIVRLLRQWMESIDNIITNLDKKLL